MARLSASARFAGVFSLDSSFEGSPARAASAGFAGGGRYTVDGGTKTQRTQVRLALERFASTVVWAYWQDAQNAYRPRGPADESAAMAPDRFRALLERLLGLVPATRAILRHPDGEGS